MRFTKLMVPFLLLVIRVILCTSPAAAQDTARVKALSGILLGNNWNYETRELDVVFSDQSVLDLGENGVRTVQLWTVIRDGAGKRITWVVTYANGMRQEVWTQQIRYIRFRTYLEKTFRRNLWDTSKKRLVDVTGQCKVMLIDKKDNNRIIATKSFILK